MGEVEGKGWDEVDLGRAESGGGGNVVGVGCDGDTGVGAEDGDGDGAADVGVECEARAVVVGGGVFGDLGDGGTAEGVGGEDVNRGGKCVEWEDSKSDANSDR